MHHWFSGINTLLIRNSKVDMKIKLTKNTGSHSALVSELMDVHPMVRIHTKVFIVQR